MPYNNVLHQFWKIIERTFQNEIFLADFIAAKKAKKGLENGQKKAIFELSTLKLNIST